MWSQQGNLSPPHKVYTSAWSRSNSKDYYSEYWEKGLSCCSQADSTLKYLANTKCSRGSNAKLKDRNCSEILLTKGITVIKWTTECNFVSRNKVKEIKKETTSHEGREFPVLSEVNFRLWWCWAEIQEARHTRNDMCFLFIYFFQCKASCLVFFATLILYVPLCSLMLRVLIGFIVMQTESIPHVSDKAFKDSINLMS